MRERAGGLSANCSDGLVTLAQRLLKLRFALRDLTLKTQFPLGFSEPEREAKDQHERQKHQPDRNNRVLRHPCEKAAEESEDVRECFAGGYRRFMGSLGKLA